ncbi:hypothetical protein QLQ12_41090 [Actinoplanes sp. NEAU-A12]|uniref:PE domain-containing protein n=1 Tax=Actinoplanes sandaracinus TaxID=3045177 RepID=A0ABT6WZ21_9ACTN|nr:hypothetical protein [Actinoplanes sandaracinus]MDI6105000.1 hypothetical protein [Actinoplanes sandaracinus]
MNVRLKLDPDVVAAAGSALAGVAQRMADDVAVLEGTVAGPGSPWGEDESGGVFALAYQAVLGHALQALGSHVQQIGEAALGLHAQASAIASTDASSAADLTASSVPTAASSVSAGPSAGTSSAANPS